MTSAEVFKAMQQGAVLCMEHSPDGEVFWMEPKHITIRSTVAKKVICFTGVVPGGDALFDGDYADQTWRVR